MKYIRFNRVIFEREREKNVNFQESFRRKGKNYRSSTFSKIRLEISLLKSSNFSLSLTYSFTRWLWVKGGAEERHLSRRIPFHSKGRFIFKAQRFFSN